MRLGTTNCFQFSSHFTQKLFFVYPVQHVAGSVLIQTVIDGSKPHVPTYRRIRVKKTVYGVYRRSLQMH